MKIRIHPSGAHAFIGMNVMDGHITLDKAHPAMVVIENAIHAINSTADVTVHLEPAGLTVSPEKQSND